MPIAQFAMGDLRKRNGVVKIAHLKMGRHFGASAPKKHPGLTPRGPSNRPRHQLAAPYLKHYTQMTSQTLLEFYTTSLGHILAP